VTCDSLWGVPAPAPAPAVLVNWILSNSLCKPSTAPVLVWIGSWVQATSTTGWLELVNGDDDESCGLWFCTGSRGSRFWETRIEIVAIGEKKKNTAEMAITTRGNDWTLVLDLFACYSVLEYVMRHMQLPIFLDAAIAITSPPSSSSFLSHSHPTLTAP